MAVFRVRGRLTHGLKLPLQAGGRDRLRGRGRGRKELRALGRAVPLESSLVDRRLRLQQDATPISFYLLFILLLVVTRVQYVTWWRHLKLIHAFEKSRERVRTDEKPSRSGQWNLLLCVCFDYVIPK